MFQELMFSNVTLRAQGLSLPCGTDLPLAHHNRSFARHNAWRTQDDSALPLSSLRRR